MKTALQLVSGIILALVFATTGWSEQTALSRHIVYLETSTDVTREMHRAIELMHQHFDRHSNMRITISTEIAAPGFFDKLETRGERYMETVFTEFESEYRFDYLLLLRKVDPGYHLFELWSRKLVYDQIYMPYTEEMRQMLPDVAANSFLSLMFQAETGFWNSKLY